MLNLCCHCVHFKPMIFFIKVVNLKIATIMSPCAGGGGVEEDISSIIFTPPPSRLLCLAPALPPSSSFHRVFAIASRGKNRREWMARERELPPPSLIDFLFNLRRELQFSHSYVPKAENDTTLPNVCTWQKKNHWQNGDTEPTFPHVCHKKSN